MTQSLTLTDFVHQEEVCRFTAFTIEDGWALGTMLRHIAVDQAAPVAIEVFAFGQQIFLSALPGSCPENLEWIRRKRNTVLRNWKATLHVGAANRLAGQCMDQQGFIHQADYCDHGGGFPLRLAGGAVIGVVTVSGLSEHEDHALVVHALTAFLQGRTAPDTTPL